MQPTHRFGSDYFVEAHDGQRYGPAKLETLNQWKVEGRISATTILIDANTLQRVTAGSIAALFPPTEEVPPLTAEFHSVPAFTAPSHASASSTVAHSQRTEAPTAPGYGASSEVVAARRRLPVWAIVLLVLGGGGILMVVVLAAILFPAFSQAKESSRRTVGLSGMKQLALGLSMYQADYDECFPRDMSSAEALKPVLFAYVKNEVVFKSVNPKGGEILGDGRLSAKSVPTITDVAGTMTLYDSLAWPDDKVPMGFADGHAKRVPFSDVAAALGRAIN